MISNYNLISNFGSGLSFIWASGDVVLFCLNMCVCVCLCGLILATMATGRSVDRHLSERSLASPSCFLCMRTLAISQIPTLGDGKAHFRCGLLLHHQANMKSVSDVCAMMIVFFISFSLGVLFGGVWLIYHSSPHELCTVGPSFWVFFFLFVLGQNLDS